MMPDGHDAIRIGIGERPQQHGIDHAEDRDVGADAERQRGGCDGGVGGTPGERATGVRQVTKCIDDRGAHRLSPAP
jgi:hypothetical protein